MNEHELEEAFQRLVAIRRKERVLVAVVWFFVIIAVAMIVVGLVLSK